MRSDPAPLRRPPAGPRTLAARLGALLAWSAGLLALALLSDLFGGAARVKLGDYHLKLASAESYRSGFADSRRTLETALAGLPTYRQALSAFDQVIARGRDTGISILNLKSSREGTGDLRELRVEVTARGSYDALKQFLRLVEGAPLPLALESVENAETEGEPGRLTLKVRLAVLHREAEE